MKKNNLFYVIFLFLNLSINNYSRAENINFNNLDDWTFLIYMEADSSLAKWALENINSMALSNPGKNLNILVQCHTVGNLAWRYVIQHGIIIQQGYVAIEEDVSNNVFNSAHWAFNTFPSKHTCLIFWNHGHGILDPHFQQNSISSFDWQSEPDTPHLQCENGTCPLKFSNFDFNNNSHINHKGTLFSMETKTYMTNETMIKTVNKIKNEILDGKKIDILGTDCCKMAMLEVGYQIKDSVDYLIGSQNCELADGWNYETLFNSFTQYLSPEQVSKLIVQTYEKYYKQHREKNIYTLSACDLSLTNELSENINLVAAACKQCIEQENNFRQMILNARSRCLGICHAPFYTDLDSFYTELLKELEINRNHNIKEDLLHELTNTLEVGKLIIQHAVVANTTGTNMTRAKGISIYFPHHNIDSSYYKTHFAQKTLWLDFLQMLM